MMNRPFGKRVPKLPGACPRHLLLTEIRRVVSQSGLPPTELLNPAEFYARYLALSKQIPFGNDELVRVLAVAVVSVLHSLPEQSHVAGLCNGLLSESLAQIVASADSHFSAGWRERHEYMGLLAVTSLARGAANGKLRDEAWERRLQGGAVRLIARHLQPLILHRYGIVVDERTDNRHDPAELFCTHKCECAIYKRSGEREAAYEARQERCANLHSISNFCGSLTLDRWNESITIALVGKSYHGGSPAEGILANFT